MADVVVIVCRMERERWLKEMFLLAEDFRHMQKPENRWFLTPSFTDRSFVSPTSRVPVFSPNNSTSTRLN